MLIEICTLKFIQTSDHRHIQFVFQLSSKAEDGRNHSQSHQEKHHLKPKFPKELRERYLQSHSPGTPGAAAPWWGSPGSPVSSGEHGSSGKQRCLCREKKIILYQNHGWGSSVWAPGSHSSGLCACRKLPLHSQPCCPKQGSTETSLTVKRSKLPKNTESNWAGQVWAGWEKEFPSKEDLRSRMSCQETTQSTGNSSLRGNKRFPHMELKNHQRKEFFLQ